MIAIEKKALNCRGFTLTELMVSMAIMTVAITATAAMMIQGATLTRNGEEVGDNNQAARTAGEHILASLRIAGMGGSKGVYVNNGGTPRLMSTVWGNDNIGGNGPDDIWMILPDRRSFSVNECILGSGGAVGLATGGVGVLNVSCAANLFGGGNSPTMLLVSNMTKPGALLTNPFLGPPSGPFGTINYAESTVANFPSRDGFQQADLVFGATAVRFYVSTDVNGTALFRDTGSLVGTSPPTFASGSVTTIVVQRYIEDLQFAYGVDATGQNNPDTYVFNAGFSDVFGGPPLRAVRVNVVAIHKRIINPGVTSASYLAPMVVENHVPASVTPDGYRRSWYVRRIELENLSPGNL